MHERMIIIEKIIMPPVLVDTCNFSWKSSRNSLIISSLASALLALLILVVVALVKSYVCGKYRFHAYLHAETDSLLVTTPSIPSKPYLHCNHFW